MTTSNRTDDVNSLLELVSRAERLEAFPRTGWQVCGIQQPESVASHSYVVTLVAMWLADRIDEPVDVEQTLRIALLHDLPEAMLTDLPRPVKRLLGADGCRRAENAAADRLFESAPADWKSAHTDYRQADSIEACIVKAADRIQMLAKALQYRAEHRGRVERFFSTRDAYDDFGLELVASIYDRLFDRFEREEWFGPGFD